jgi:hypothetical protein
MKNLMIALAALLLGVTSGRAALADDLAAVLEKVTKDQIAAFNKEDVDATLAFAYTKSPAYDTARADLPKLFAEEDAKGELVDFKYIGHDDEFAVARVKVKVTADEAGFQDNIVDSLMLFHFENGAWKVFDSYLLAAKLTQ